MTLRRGWARGEARPWNDEFADAHLRLVRGGAQFLAAATAQLFELGAPTVISPPLTERAQSPWREAGFSLHSTLALLKFDLASPPPPPDHLVAAGADADLQEAIRIECDAFEPFWKLDGLGLHEAMEATPRSRLLVIRNRDGGLCAFAVIGFGSALAYLQRLAVDPRWQRCGMGRSIVRASARAARAEGARAILLNTQEDNVPAIRLYQSEGYTILDESLELLHAVA